MNNERAEPVPERRPAKVLLVDGDVSVRKLGYRLLHHAGYEVVLAGDGQQALRIAHEQGPFDLFILDIMVPWIRGLQLTDLLRQISPSFKVLYLTGHQLSKEQLTLAVNEDLLEKPLTRDGLLEAVSLILFGHLRGPMTDRTND
jgi:CheY-like chemotaxis protein